MKGIKGFFSKAFAIVKAAAKSPIVQPLISAGAAAIGMPFLATVLNAAIYAESGGGTGPEKFQRAADSLRVSAPLIIHQLEQQFGVDIPDEAAEAFIQAQLQSFVDLMNATGMLPKKQ